MAITDMGEIYYIRDLHLRDFPCSNSMLNDNSSNRVYDFCERKRFIEKRTELSNVVIVKVVCGRAHALALSNEGQVYIFKNNCFNLLNIPELQKILDIAAVYHSDRSAILGDNGHIYVWGNYFGCDIKSPIVTQFSTMQEALRHNIIDAYPIILSMNELGYIDVQSNILECSQTLFDDPSTSDFTIQVKNHSIYVHKAILRSRSEYFESMFRNFKEKDQSILTLPSVYSYTAYKAFLKYLYTGVIDLPMHKLLKLFKLAMMLCDTKLISSCIREIKRKVTLANIIFVYSTAMEYNNENLKKFSIKFAVNYMLSTTQIESDKEIDENILESFKKEIANAKSAS
ncbi:RCC1 and BTB domain-containing protein 1 [Camponotus floridanus]|uniref:RCC1 and BTB domain-containing protein 1 n=2 Tax=Camponotus floridanus TaxID=104421 RepID=E2AJK3_CAMFO|nr:RCC1 and BTB domain-containing protein 1 [Camponotus floridanus]